MSDTHDMHDSINVEDLPAGDIFIHAGDFSRYSLKEQFERFRQFLKSLPYKHKVVIPGNHDLIFHDDRWKHEIEKRKLKKKKKSSKCKKQEIIEEIDPEEEREKMKTVCTFLEHQMVQIEGIRIFGSALWPQFYDGAFVYCPNRSDKVLQQIPSNIDILVTHWPPLGILDKTDTGDSAGSEGILVFVQKLRPQVHIFGHIHEAFGWEYYNEIRFYNSSMTDQNYEIVNECQIMEVLKNEFK